MSRPFFAWLQKVAMFALRCATSKQTSEQTKRQRFASRKITRGDLLAVCLFVCCFVGLLWVAFVSAATCCATNQCSVHWWMLARSTEIRASQVRAKYSPFSELRSMRAVMNLQLSNQPNNAKKAFQLNLTAIQFGSDLLQFDSIQVRINFEFVATLIASKSRNCFDCRPKIEAFHSFYSLHSFSTQNSSESRKEIEINFASAKMAQESQFRIWIMNFKQEKKKSALFSFEICKMTTQSANCSQRKVASSFESRALRCATQQQLRLSQLSCAKMTQTQVDFLLAA